MDAADPGDPDSDSLVTLVYNVQDENYYDCAEDTYTAGYFAPEYIDSVGMNVIVSTPSTGPTASARTRAPRPGPTVTRPTTAPSCTRASSPTSSSTC